MSLRFMQMIPNNPTAVLDRCHSNFETRVYHTDSVVDAQLLAELLNSMQATIGNLRNELARVSDGTNPTECISCDE